MFHVLSFGGAYLQVEREAEPIRVEDGAVLLFPTGHPHSLYDDPTSPLTRVVHLDYNPQRGYQIVDREGEGPKLLMLCGAFHFEYPMIFHCYTVYPNSSIFPGHRGKASIVRLIARESASQQPGAEVMQSRLTELLFIPSHPALDRSTS
jgi:hypothetical protein